MTEKVIPRQELRPGDRVICLVPWKLGLTGLVEATLQQRVFRPSLDCWDAWRAVVDQNGVLIVVTVDRHTRRANVVEILRAAAESEGVERVG